MSAIKVKFIKFCWIIFTLIWVGIIAIFIAIYFGLIGYMPHVEDLQNPIDKYASQVISSDGEILGSFAQTGNNRLYADIVDISPNVLHALEATEDKRFREHSGIDFLSLPRVLLKTVIFRQRQSGGGSTITQQLAKQLYSSPADNLWHRLMQKPIEWAIAVKLERYYTKDEIESMYLNQFDFLYNAVGIKSAAMTYFDKLPRDLNVQESAMLVGMCKNPSVYNPVLRKKSNLPVQRRNVVLSLMEQKGYISSRECDSLKQLPLGIKFIQRSHNDGSAPYLREYLRRIMMAKKPNKYDYREWQEQQYVDDSIAWENDPLYGWCYKNHKSDGSNYNIYVDGLKIYTTINSVMQTMAEKSVRKQMSTFLQPSFDREKKNLSNPPYENNISKDQVDASINKAIKQSDRYRVAKKNGLSETEIMKDFKTKTEMQIWSWNGIKDTIMSPIDSIKYIKGLLRTGFMAMNVHNGYVLAYVGGIDYTHFKYDMVSFGRRQIGSTIKPMLYSLSMIEGFNPCDKVLHVPQTLYTESGKSWTPRNDNKYKVNDSVTIKWGLQNSDNWVTAFLMGKTSPFTFRDILRSFGLQGPIDPTVSMCLGTPDASVKEMVSAYSVFVNKGVRVSPVFVSHIVDKTGNVVGQFTSNMTEVLPEDASYKMNIMMQSVVNGGTGSRLRNRYLLKMPLGGKTGTTQSNSDGWFVGFSPDIVAGAWVGGDEPKIHFRSMALGQGASSALPIFAEFMKMVYASPILGYKESTQFEIPKDFDPCAKSLDEDLVPLKLIDNTQSDKVDDSFM